MKHFIISVLLLAASQSQAQDFIVERAPFSSKINDEFSPVFYRDGIVFCSNMRDNSLVGYTDDKSRLFKMYFIKGKANSWGLPELLSKELTSGYNDGPVTFTPDGQKMYYSRNNTIGKFIGNISDPTNRLGIYAAELTGGIWGNVKPFIYNDPEYSLCSPSVSPENDRMYFSSDMPGGQGGMDLWYSDFASGIWQQPVNLGPVVNTPDNETFPFASTYKKLYFSSDGHTGLGGKDLYYTQEINGSWIVPVHLDSAINSPADDFGIVIDTTFESGFFSSHRNKTDDIFSFRLAPLEFSDCDTVKEDNFCFTFFDEKYNEIDTIPVRYIWNFGEGEEHGGPEIRHCFKGPGTYEIKLLVMDDLTGDTISLPASYNAVLEYIDQAYIGSPDKALIDDRVRFEVNNHLKNFSITDYLWDFGKGFEPGGPVMEKSFTRKGEYAIKLGLLGKQNDLEVKRCFLRMIRIYNSQREINN